MSLHNGHRQRMKDRFLITGYDGMSEHEILEMLLYYSIPRSNTNDIAHRLITQFGSITDVVNAPVSELQKVDGIGANTAFYLTMLGATFRYLQIRNAKKKKILRDYKDFGDYLRNFFIGMRNEIVYLLCLDAKSSVIGCYKISEGNVNATNIPYRKILEISINTNASAVVLAHNHPGGFAMASTEDVAVTFDLARTLMVSDIVLLDHIIVSDDSFISLEHTGSYSYEDVLNANYMD